MTPDEKIGLTRLRLFCVVSLAVTCSLGGCKRVSEETTEGVIRGIGNVLSEKNEVTVQACNAFAPKCVKAFLKTPEDVSFARKWRTIYNNSSGWNYQSDATMEYQGSLYRVQILFNVYDGSIDVDSVWMRDECIFMLDDWKDPDSFESLTKYSYLKTIREFPQELSDAIILPSPEEADALFRSTIKDEI